MASNLIHLSIFAFFPALMALSASMDLLTFTIPNRICVALALGYVIFAALLGVPAVDILLNMSCGLAILVITFAMFNFGLIGGGDAKLAAATAAWLGWAAILDYGLAAAIFGGILTLILLGARTVPLPAALARVAWLARLHDAKRRRPIRNCIGGGGPHAIPELIHLGCGGLGRHPPPPAVCRSAAGVAGVDPAGMVAGASTTTRVRFRSFLGRWAIFVSTRR